jgi:hypothetical protein
MRLGAVALCLFAGCGRTTDGGDTQTNWLSCGDEQACPSGQRCAAGVCVPDAAIADASGEPGPFVLPDGAAQEDAQMISGEAGAANTCPAPIEPGFPQWIFYPKDPGSPCPAEAPQYGAACNVDPQVECGYAVAGAENGVVATYQCAPGAGGWTSSWRGSAICRRLCSTDDPSLVPITISCDSRQPSLCENTSDGPQTVLDTTLTYLLSNCGVDEGSLTVILDGECATAYALTVVSLAYGVTASPEACVVQYLSTQRFPCSVGPSCGYTHRACDLC